MKNESKTISFVSSGSFVLDQAKYLLISLRPKHWIKNLFIFSPLFFSGRFRHPMDFYIILKGFIIFSLAASSVYLLNDIIDRERDAQSPTNKIRPIAAGKVTIFSATAGAVLLQLLALMSSYFLSLDFLFLIVLYLLNNLLYTLYIKNKVIVDIISIAMGFVIRILAGAVLINVEVSHWLLICTFNLSMLLGFGKRRAELFHARGVRSVNEIYTESKLDHMISVSAAVTLFSYMLYAVAPENTSRVRGDYLVYTVPFVVYGIFRYVAKIQEGKYRDPIHLIYSDRVFIFNIMLWIIAILIILIHAYRM